MWVDHVCNDYEKIMFLDFNKHPLDIQTAIIDYGGGNFYTRAIIRS